MNGIVAQNNLVKQAEAKIESQLSRAVKKGYMKIVVAGMKYAMNGGPKSLLANLKESQDIVTDVVKGAVSVVGLLRRASRGSMPVEAMIPAAMVLVLHGLDYAERLGKVKVDESVLDAAVEKYIDLIAPAIGVTPERLAKATEEIGNVVSDPEKAGQLQAAYQAQGQK